MTEKMIVKEALVPAPPSEVWRAWTTNEGAVTFFAPAANIELRLDGPYEILFDPEAPRGERGAEDLSVLAYVPGEMLAFRWNAPPHLPNVRRDRRSFVVVRLAPEGENSTRVKLAHLGFGAGEEWDRCYDYFLRAWDIVMTRLVERFTTGPLFWEKIR